MPVQKSPEAFRTISEAADWLGTPAHVLRFWESRFPEIAPVKRAGGRRYYRPDDLLLIGGIKRLLHDEGNTIKAVQQRIKSEGVAAIAALSPPLETEAAGTVPEAAAPASPVAQETEMAENVVPMTRALSPDDGEAERPASPAGLPEPEEPPRQAVLFAEGAAPPVEAAEAAGPFVAAQSDGSGSASTPPSPEVEAMTAPVPADALRQGSPMPTLPDMPDDPADGASLPGPVLSPAAVLRGIETASGPLAELHRRLVALRDRLK